MRTLGYERIKKSFEERTIRFGKDDLIPAKKIPCLNLDDLEETAAYVFPGSDDYLLIECKPTRRNTRCAACGRSGYLKSNGYTDDPRLVHDINAGRTQVDLSVTVPKYVCGYCGAKPNHSFESIDYNKQYTKRLYDQIKVDAFYDHFEDVATRYGISSTNVGNIFDQYAAELEAKRGEVRVGPWLAIDEKHINHSMRGVFVDGMSGQLLEMTEDNSPDTVRKTIMSLRGYENIEIVTTDMANGYKAVIEEVFGSNVKLVVDKWHVLNDLQTKITKCKTAISDYLNDKIKQEPDPEVRARKLSIKKLLSDNPYLFKFSDEKLAEKDYRLIAIAEVCSTFPEYNHLRLLKEQFEMMYDCEDRESAEAVLEKWCKLVPPSGKRQIAAWEAEHHVPAHLYEEMRALLTTVRDRWHKEIFNYFDVERRVTNAVAEATNAFIERFVIDGYSFKRLRAKCLFWHIAGSRTRYVITLRKKATTSSMFDKPLDGKTHFIPGGYSGTTTYEDVYGIFCDEIPNNNPPFSVYSFLPEDDLNYVRDQLFPWVEV